MPWSASDAAANGFPLSNGGLTFTGVENSNYPSIRGTTSHNSGKVYVEFLANATGVLDVFFGLASASLNITSFFGNSNYSCGMETGNANAVSAGFASNYTMSAALAIGDVFALAVNFTTTGSIWVARNNVWFGGNNPSTGSTPAITFTKATVGALFPGMSVKTNTTTWTIKTTTLDQTYAPPSGFVAWDGVGVGQQAMVLVMA